MMNDRDRLDRTRDDRLTERTAGVGRLAALDDLDDFKVADEDPDIRGWDVKTTDGRKIGDVHNLIVDTAAMRVRYIDVELDKDALNLREDRHVLIPVGRAQLDEDDDNVILPGLTAQQCATLPAYTHGSLTRDQEVSMVNAWPAAGATKSEERGEFYDRDYFDDRRFWGKRREGRENENYLVLSEEQLAVGKRQKVAGEVEVRKAVETEHVRESVPLTHEEVTVERRPATPGMSTKPHIGEDEIRVPLMEEEAVVEKRTVPKEEVVIRKEAKTTNKTVEADLRKERVDIDKEGDVRRT